MGALLCALVNFAVTGRTVGQVQSGSPSELIRYLTYQSDRPGKLSKMAGGFGCGQTADDRDDRAAARSLVKLGSAATPEVLKAIDSIEEAGRQSAYAANAQLLLIAYASLDGRNASPRLRRMVSSGKLGFLQVGLDAALALSLGLTSYVDVPHSPARILRCRAGEPRDALNQLIVAWERNDRVSFRASLGPDAGAALATLLRGSTWEGVRSELSRGRPDGGAALGYRFEAPGAWSKPEVTLEEPANGGSSQGVQTPDLSTVFTNDLGAQCGTYRVRFLPTSGGRLQPVAFVVDNSDLRGLLAVISSCAAQAAGAPQAR
jgi:hypothetical protein